jgi:hypothetical protein
MLGPVFKTLHKSAEAMMLGTVGSKAKKCKLPGNVIKELEEKAAWNPAARDVVNMAAPKVAAKWLNKSGISAEWQDEIALAGGYATIGLGYMALCRRLDEIARQVNAPAAKPGQPAADGAQADEEKKNE